MPRWRRAVRRVGPGPSRRGCSARRACSRGRGTLPPRSASRCRGEGQPRQRDHASRPLSTAAGRHRSGPGAPARAPRRCRSRTPRRRRSRRLPLPPGRPPGVPPPPGSSPACRRAGASPGPRRRCGTSWWCVRRRPRRAPSRPRRRRSGSSAAGARRRRSPSVRRSAPVPRALRDSPQYSPLRRLHTRGAGRPRRAQEPHGRTARCSRSTSRPA